MVSALPLQGQGQAKDTGTWGAPLINNHFPQDISAQPRPQVSKKTGSQPQCEWPTPDELELGLTQTSGPTLRGPTPYQSGQMSATRAWSFGQTVHSSPSPRLDPLANASLLASRGSDPQWQADALWSPALSQQHFRHNCLLPALSFHGFLHIPDHKLPRIKDWVTSFSCFLTPGCFVPGLAQQGRCQSPAGESPAPCILHP